MQNIIYYISTLFFLGMLPNKAANVLNVTLSFLLYVLTSIYVVQNFEANIDNLKFFLINSFITITVIYLVLYAVLDYYFRNFTDKIDKIYIDKFTGIYLMFSINSPFYGLYSTSNNIVFAIFFIVALPIALFFYLRTTKIFPLDIIDKKTRGALKLTLNNVATVFLSSILHQAILLFYLDFNS